jgi:Tfp pilus assembly protein PilN
MNNDINLLDYRSKTEAQKESERQKALRKIAVGGLFFVSALSIMIFILIALSPLPELERQQEIASVNLSNSSADIIKLELARERAVSIRELIQKRKKYNEILENLRRMLPANTTFTTMSIEENSINFSVSSSSLFAIDNFMSQLKSQGADQYGYSEIVVSRLSADIEKKEFSVDVSIRML